MARFEFALGRYRPYALHSGPLISVRGEAGSAGLLLAGWWKPRITRPISNRPEAPPPVITRFRRVIQEAENKSNLRGTVWFRLS